MRRRVLCLCSGSWATGSTKSWSSHHSSSVPIIFNHRAPPLRRSYFLGLTAAKLSTVEVDLASYPPSPPSLVLGFGRVSLSARVSRPEFHHSRTSPLWTISTRSRPTSHQCFYGAKLHRLNCCLLVTTGPIVVQECCFARFTHDYFTAASRSHYAVSSIDGSSQSRICGLSDLLVVRTIVQECGFVRFINYITAAPPSQYAVSSINGSSHSQLRDLQIGIVARKPNHPEAFYLLSDVRSHMIWLNKCDDCMLRSLSVTNYWTRHGNVEFRGLDPIKSSALSSNFILRASLEAKLELEIHLVSSVSLVWFKADCACFNVISSQIGLRTVNVAYGSGAFHLKFLPVNIPTSYRCINVVFDYQLFFRTIAMGTKVELSFGFLHFAEHDSPLDGFYL